MTEPHPPHNRSSLAERGFTLLEVILGLALAGSVAFVGVQALKGWAQSEKASATASYIQKLRDATEDMLHGPRDFEVFYSLADSNGGSVEIPIYTTDPALPASVMYGIKSAVGVNGSVAGSPSVSRLSESMNPLRVPMTLVVATDSTAGQRSLHIALVSGEPVPEEMARKTASLLGGEGGYISAVPPTTGTCLTTCERTLRGAFGDWQVDLNAFNGTSWEVNVSSDPPSPSNGAYLVSYRHVSANAIEGDYLYRSQIAENPGLNTMHVPLDLANNSLIGVDNVHVAKDLTVRDGLFAQGHANLAGNLSTSEMVVDGNVFGGTMEISRSFVSDPAKINEVALQTSGTFLIDGTLASSNAGINNTLGGMVRVEDYFQDSDDNHISADHISMAGLQNKKGDFFIKGTSHIGSLKVKDTLTIGALKASSLKADKIEATNTLIERNIDITGDLETTTPVLLNNVVFNISKPPPVYNRVWGSMDDCSKHSDGIWWCNDAEVLDTEFPNEPFLVHPGTLLPDGLTTVINIKLNDPDRGVHVEKGGKKFILDIY